MMIEKFGEHEFQLTPIALGFRCLFLGMINRLLSPPVICMLDASYVCRFEHLREHV